MIGKRLGHSDIEKTARYAHMACDSVPPPLRGFPTALRSLLCRDAARLTEPNIVSLVRLRHTHPPVLFLSHRPLSVPSAEMVIQ